MEWSEDLGKMPFKKAIQVCEGMDGRLPDRLELMDLYYDYPEERKKMKDIYWSTRKQGNSGGWAVDFGDSDNDADPEISSCSVRCVRETAKGK